MNFAAVLQYGSLFFQGFLVTLKLAVMATILGTILGAVVGIIITGRIKVLKAIFRIYIELFRGSPLLIQLFMIYFCLPKIGINVSMETAVLVSFTLYSGAYIAEIVRSGIQSIPIGQWEAAESIGLTYWQMMAFVILPQIIKVSLAPYVGFCLGLIKDTSLASTIGYLEVVRIAKNVMNLTGTPFESYLVVAACFFIICWPLSLLVKKIERRTVVQ